MHYEEAYNNLESNKIFISIFHFQFKRLRNNAVRTKKRVTVIRVYRYTRVLAISLSTFSYMWDIKCQNPAAYPIVFLDRVNRFARVRIFLNCKYVTLSRGDERE